MAYRLNKTCFLQCLKMPSELFMSDSVFVFKDLEAAQPGIADVLIILGKIKIVGPLLAIDTREVEEKPFEKSYGNRFKVSHARIIQAEHIPVIEAFHKNMLSKRNFNLGWGTRSQKAFSKQPEGFCRITPMAGHTAG
jgi:hypothetical protein